MQVQAHIFKDAAIEPYFQGLLQELGSTDIFYQLGFLYEVQTKAGRTFWPQFHRDLAQRGVDDRAIYGREVESMIRRLYQENPHLSLRFQAMAFPLDLIICKDRVIQMGQQPERFVLEIKDPDLCEAYQHYFLQQWQRNQAPQLVEELCARFGLPYDPKAQARIKNSQDYPQVLSVLQGIRLMEDGWTAEKAQLEQQKLWSVPETSAEFLERFVVATNSRMVLELGTSAGYSALHLAMGTGYIDGQVISVEKLEYKYQLAQKHLEQSGLSNLKLIQGTAADVLQNQQFPGLDLVFMDADKEHYLQHYEVLIPQLKVGGFIIVDNALDYRSAMADYCARVLGSKRKGGTTDPRVCSFLLSLDNGLLITQKIRD